MGEDAKQEEKPKEEVIAKEEEKKEERIEEVKKEEEKKEEEEKKDEPKPPEPFVLSMDLHCMGCAKKIERTILKIRGVEGVAIDMAQNKVAIKGVIEPEAVCNIIMKKTKRAAKVLSPLPAAEGEPMPQVVASQVSGLLTTVELNVNMHCDACAEQLKRMILKMKGVRGAEADASSGKVIVTGTMDAKHLVDYVYRRTKKQAKIIPQPKPEPEKPVEDAKPEEKREEENNSEGGEKPPEGEKKEGGDVPAEENKPTEEQSGDGPKEDGGGGEGVVVINSMGDHEQIMHKMMYHYYQPLYMIERIPPPQLFSDENPNACCII